MRRKLPPLNAIRAFEAAARLESFTKAAEELLVTHGAISQQIKLLEEFYQKPLFVRARGKVFLNDDGQLLLPVVRESLNQITTVSAKILASNDDNILTINLTSAFASQWLVPRLISFQQKHPDITIRLAPSPVFEGFLEEDADVSIRWGRNSFSNTQMIKLFDVDAFVACAPILLVAEKPLTGLSSIKDQTLLHDDDGSAWATWLDQAGVKDVDPRSGHYFADSALALQAAIDGQGLITAGSILAAHDLAAERLVIPFDIFMRNRNAYYLSFPVSSAKQRKVKLFEDWITSAAMDYVDKRVSMDKYIR